MDVADDSIDWLIVFLGLVGMEVDDSLLGGAAVSLSLLGATSSSVGGGEGGGGGGSGGGVVMVNVSTYLYLSRGLWRTMEADS